MESSRPASCSVSQPQDPVKPIPAFYCSYLLRSTVWHASLYIGSTPNPARRLAQHNGLIQGGAKKTNRDKSKPWDMVLIVSGFMSRVAALQFEWAWQHTDRSRHAESDDDSATQPDGRRGKKSSHLRGVSLKAIISRLHLLLRSKYFSTWPLEVRFFSADVHRVWQQWSAKEDWLLPDSIKVVVDVNPDIHISTGRSRSVDGTGSVNCVDISNNKLKSYREKVAFLLDDEEQINCGVCKRPLHLEDDLIVVCSHEHCRCASHIVCLSSSFLEGERIHDKIIPTSGQCPSCRLTIEWATLMREVSLRTWAQTTE